MAPNWQKFDNNVNSFNEKYGVSFSLGAFNARATALSMVNAEIGNDTAYKASLSNIIHEMAMNRVLDTNAPAVTLEVVKDFEKLVMSPYRADCKKSGEVAPKKLAGMKRGEILEMMKYAMEKAPNTKVGLAEYKYNSGNVRIRDMRAKAQALQNAETFTDAQVDEIASYASALEKINNERSRAWRIFHPFRNRAEKREAENMKNIVKNKFDISSYSLHVAKVDKRITTPNVALKENITSIENSINGIENVVSENVKREPMTKADFYKVGYRPNAEDFENEWKLIDELHVESKNPDFLKDDPNRNAAINLIGIHHMRCLLVKGALGEGGVEKAKSIMEKMSAYYATEDARFTDKNPNYKPPVAEEKAEIKEDVKAEIKEGIKEEIKEKEPISVNIEEPVSEVSDKIEIKTTGAIEKDKNI